MKTVKMPQYISRLAMRIFPSIILLLLFLFFSSVRSVAQQPETEVQWDPAMRIPSPEETSSWFPELAVDSQGHVHVVWNETNHLAMNHAQPGDEVDPESFESVYYSIWDGQKWMPYNDILPPQRDIIRSAIAIDSQDVIHLVYGWFEMYHKQARTNESLSAAAWTSPQLVNSRKRTYMKDMVIHEDTVHIVYDDSGAEEGACPDCADIFYRHSNDGGRTWSVPLVLYPTDLGSNYAQIEIDKIGTIYVVWNEGWDRFSGVGAPQSGLFMYSADGGNTWSAPTVVSYPNSTNLRLTVGSDGQGGIILVWRTASPEYPGIYYMWSTDYGESWTPPHTLPNIFAQSAIKNHGSYSMATDSAGHIHLLVVGRLQVDQASDGVYHFEWDGQKWSNPSPVYDGDWFPSYAKLVIDRGNQLHATWYVAADPWDDFIPHQVWYAHGQSSAPVVIPTVQPTFTPSPEPEVVATQMPSPTPTSTATPTPTLDPGSIQLSVAPGATESIYTETDELVLLAKSLIPAMLIITAVVVGIRLLRR